MRTQNGEQLFFTFIYFYIAASCFLALDAHFCMENNSCSLHVWWHVISSIAKYYRVVLVVELTMEHMYGASVTRVVVYKPLPSLIVTIDASVQV